MTILDEILDRKRSEVEGAKAIRGPSELSTLARRAESPATRGFLAQLRAAPRPRIIAEVKRRSPSRGELRLEFDPVACARAYADAGAAAISVLTDEHYFGGHIDFLERIRAEVPLPLLRKDFVVDAYQIDESRHRGADAVLLIAAAFGGAGGWENLAVLRRASVSVGLDALVEVHDEAELEAALAAGADLVGINNRDLRTFEVDLGVTERLAPRVPEGVVVVAESGIFKAEDVTRLEASGAHVCLVGEALMREPDLGEALRRLRRSS